MTCEEGVLWVKKLKAELLEAQFGPMNAGVVVYALGGFYLDGEHLFKGVGTCNQVAHEGDFEAKT